MDTQVLKNRTFSNRGSVPFYIFWIPFSTLDALIQAFPSHDSMWDMQKHERIICQMFESSYPSNIRFRLKISPLISSLAIKVWLTTENKNVLIGHHWRKDLIRAIYDVTLPLSITLGHNIVPNINIRWEIQDPKLIVSIN